MTINEDGLWTLLISCPDQNGIIASVTTFLARNGANIVDLDEHVDREGGVFFMRLEWTRRGFRLEEDAMRREFAAIARSYSMSWTLHGTGRRARIAIFVSRQTHCLYDLLARAQSGEWNAEIAFILGNHRDLETAARRHDIPFYFLPVTEETRREQEEQSVSLLQADQVDLIVLAKYMRVLSPDFVRPFRNRIINIHHSFLPAFAGARPYHAAHERGVKVIGATSHYVTEELDGGPIIEQDVIPVTHKDSVEDLIRKGRDLEKIVLSRAIWYHLNHKLLVHGNRTIVFQ